MTTLHLISHTHWDREWYLTFQQFHLKLVHLIDKLLDILESDPDYKCFMLDGQTIILDDYLQVRPERKEQLQHFVQNGRLLIGPWHILPDEFLVSPEATIRNLLEGDRTAKVFGLKMMVGYIPDTFGHIGQMPQILQGFGIQTASVQRGLSDEPSELWWLAPDNSRVFLAYLRDGYSNAAGLLTSEPERFLGQIVGLRDSLAPHSASGPQGHLLLMHGTDHMEPPPDTSAAITRANEDLHDCNLVHSSLPAYLEAVQPSIHDRQSILPSITGELRSSKRHPLLPNVLSTRMWIKQRNHVCETLLEKWAEPFSLWAEQTSSSRSGGDKRVHDRYITVARLANPSEVIRYAWRLLLECHPHDSICGCSIDQVCEEMRPRFDQVEQIGEEITHQSLTTLAALIDTHPPASLRDFNIISGVTVYNPAPGPRTEVVTLDVELPPFVRNFKIVSPDGGTIPIHTQGMRSLELINMELDRKAFENGLNMVHDGKVLGWVVHDFHWERHDKQVKIQVVLADKGKTNPVLWSKSLREVKALLADKEINQYVVHAQSAPVARAIVQATDVPGFGYKTFWIVDDSQPVQETATTFRVNLLINTVLLIVSKLRVLTAILQKWFHIPTRPPRSPRKPSSNPPYSIENEFFDIEVERSHGTITLKDKRNGAEYPGLNSFVNGGDYGDAYNFSPPLSDNIIRNGKVKRVYIERNPVQQSIDIDLVLRIPGELNPDRKERSQWMINLPITTRLILTKGVPRLDIQTTVNNGTPDSPRACDHRLRVHFPLPYNTTEAYYDGHFEIVCRPVGLPVYDDSWVEEPRPEVPQRLFTSTTDGKLGLVLANRGLPEIEVIRTPNGKSEIALTLLRCVGWLSRDDFSTRKGHAGPGEAIPAAQMPGKHTFEYSIIPICHNDGDNKNTIMFYNQAYAFNLPMRAIQTAIQPGTLPPESSLIKVDPDRFIISTIKATEDGTGWIVRGYNLGSESIRASISPWRRFGEIERVNLAEEFQEKLLSSEEGIVTFPVSGYKIVTIKFSD